MDPLSILQPSKAGCLRGNQKEAKIFLCSWVEKQYSDFVGTTNNKIF